MLPIWAACPHSGAQRTTDRRACVVGGRDSAGSGHCQRGRSTGYTRQNRGGMDGWAKACDRRPVQRAATARIFWPGARLQEAGPRGSSDCADSGVDTAVVPQGVQPPACPVGSGQYLINDAGSCWARLFSVSARSPRFWANWASAAQKVPCTVLSPRRLLSHGSPVWKEAVASAWASLQLPVLGVGRYGESVPLLLSPPGGAPHQSVASPPA